MGDAQGVGETSSSVTAICCANHTFGVGGETAGFRCGRGFVVAFALGLALGLAMAYPLARTFGSLVAESFICNGPIRSTLGICALPCRLSGALQGRAIKTQT